MMKQDKKTDIKKMSKWIPIEGYKVAPKLSMIVILMLISPALLSLFDVDLGLAPIIIHISNSIAILLTSVFVIPQLISLDNRKERS